jgi:hypothetical protein
MVGSICVSYVRARAEVEGITLYDGLFTRVVRILFLSFGLIVGGLNIILWVLAVMTLFTTFQRLFVVYQRLRGTEERQTTEEAEALIASLGTWDLKLDDWYEFRHRERN